jgi:hypothetical protein
MELNARTHRKGCAGKRMSGKRDDGVEVRVERQKCDFQSELTRFMGHYA